jgi:hypothetical protein
LQPPCPAPTGLGPRPARPKPAPSAGIYVLNTFFYIICGVEPAAWLARVRHDFCKRLLWPARDRRDVGGESAPGELVPALVDDEGQPVTPRALWAALAAEAPPGLDLDRFTAAVGRVIAAAEAGDAAGVLELEAAFDDLAVLARSLDPKR